MSANDARKQSIYFPEDMLAEIQAQAQRLDRSLGSCSKRGKSLRLSYTRSPRRMTCLLTIRGRGPGRGENENGAFFGLGARAAFPEPAPEVEQERGSAPGRAGRPPPGTRRARRSLPCAAPPRARRPRCGDVHRPRRARGRSGTGPRAASAPARATARARRRPAWSGGSQAALLHFGTSGFQRPARQSSSLPSSPL